MMYLLTILFSFQGCSVFDVWQPTKGGDKGGSGRRWTMNLKVGDAHQWWLLILSRLSNYNQEEAWFLDGHSLVTHVVTNQV